jgi:hypothetical protein
VEVAGVLPAWNRELDFGNVTPDRREEPQRAKRAEDRGVARVPKRVCQARRWGLDKSASACGDVSAPSVQERGQRSAAKSSGCVGWAAAIPVDFTASANLSGFIGIVDGPESRTKLVHSALNRCCGWAGCLEYGWRFEALCIIGLRKRRLRARQTSDACKRGKGHGKKFVGEAALRRV